MDRANLLRLMRRGGNMGQVIFHEYAKLLELDCKTILSWMEEDNRGHRSSKVSIRSSAR